MEEMTIRRVREAPVDPVALLDPEALLAKVELEVQPVALRVAAARVVRPALPVPQAKVELAAVTPAATLRRQFNAALRCAVRWSPGTRSSEPLQLAARRATLPTLAAALCLQHSAVHV